MNRHSLIDYLADDNGTEAADATRKTAELLEHRLDELANRLATLRTEASATPDQAFASQIESIHRRRQQQEQRCRADASSEQPHPRCAHSMSSFLQERRGRCAGSSGGESPA